MSLTLGQAPWLLILLIAVAVGLAVWSYRGTVPALSPGKQAVLTGLRALTLAIVLFLLAEPLLQRTDVQEEPPTLAILIDQSKSVGLMAADSAGLNAQLAQALTEDALGASTQLYTFGSRLLPLPPDSLGTLAYEGERTNIASALDAARDDLDDANLQGVILLTDGRYNTGRNPLYTAERYPVPIHTVVLGDTTQQRDVVIRRVTTNDIAYLGTELPVQVSVRTEGYANETLRVTLLQDGAVVGSSPLPTRGAGEYTATLAYTPQATGTLRLTATVSRLDGELTYENNRSSTLVRVVENKRRILLVADAAAPDVSALRQVLSADPNTEVSTLTRKAVGQYFEGAVPDLASFDLLVLVNYPGRSTDPQLAAGLTQAHNGGTPVFFLLGPQTQAQALNGNVFADLLPALPARVRASSVDATIVPTPAALRHPIFDTPAATAFDWNRLPPLRINESTWEVDASAQTLATVRIRGIDFPNPLVVIQRQAGRRSAMFLGAESWRWLNVAEDLDDARQLWLSLLDNTVQWLTTPEDDRPVRVAPNALLFTGDEAVQLSGQVYDESLNPISDATVIVNVQRPDGTTSPYTMQARGSGLYALDAGSLPEGTYTYTASAERNGSVLGDDAGSFRVGALDLEFRDTRADASLMRQVAQRSGGRALSIDQLDTLPAQLAELSLPVRRTEAVVETPLWHRYPFLVAIAVLLTIEWFLRKRSGMV
ncbi:MAG: carboxypeptidase-like regulatory domain-containing protein [Bacteroidota bacterium]